VSRWDSEAADVSKVGVDRRELNALWAEKAKVSQKHRQRCLCNSRRLHFAFQGISCTLTTLSITLQKYVTMMNGRLCPHCSGDADDNGSMPSSCEMTGGL
jgi:hypothetical protein